MTGFRSTPTEGQTLGMFVQRHPLIRLCFVNGTLGALAATTVVGGLMASNAHGLRTLVMGQPDGWIAVAVLTAGFVVTLGSVAIGMAVMMLPNSRDNSTRRPGLPAHLAPARITRRH